jgi:ATP-dependent helicase Lhr and Lhr-like helicase
VVDVRRQPRERHAGPGTVPATLSQVDHDCFLLDFESRIGIQELRQVLDELRSADVASMQPDVDESALEGLKFSECLPAGVGVGMLERRLAAPESVQIAVNQPVRFTGQADQQPN